MQESQSLQQEASRLQALAQQKLYHAEVDVDKAQLMLQSESLPSDADIASARVYRENAEAEMGK